jgi:serpin B
MSDDDSAPDERIDPAAATTDIADERALDTRAASARADVEANLDPQPPPIASVAQRARHRRALVTTSAAVVVVLGLLAGLLIVRRGDETETTHQAGSTEPARTSEPSGTGGGTPVKVQLIRSSVRRQAGDPAAAADAVTAETHFATDLYRQLSTTEHGNLFFSPHSIDTALSMTMAGAAGKTRSEMRDVLHVTISEAAYDDALNALDQSLQAPRPLPPGEHEAQPLSLTIGNSLWGQQGFPFRQAFLDRLARSYGAGMNLVDFVQRAEESRKAINDSVAIQTKGLIKELIPQGVINDMVRLVLVNTIHFKASWAHEMDLEGNKPFTTATGKQVRTPMISTSSDDATTGTSGDGWSSATIPYAGAAHMVIVVPDDFSHFDLTPAILQKAASATAPTKVVMPKFKVTSQLDLAAPLIRLGMRDAFNPARADFSGMDGRRDLFVSAVVHQATVTVDEKGTEAAAATAVIMGTASAHLPPPILRVDRPFVFAIRDDKTGAILFMGRVTDPTA